MGQTHGAGILLATSNAYSGGGTAGSSAYNGGTWVNLGGIVDVDPPMQIVTDIKTTAATDTVQTYDPGRQEPGELKTKFKHTGTLEATLNALLGVAKGFVVVYSDGSLQGFQGYIKSIGEKVDLEQLVTIEVTFKVSGAIYQQPSSSS